MVEIGGSGQALAMHIQDGVLPLGTLVGGYVLAGAWIGWHARKLDPDDMPRISVMSAAFFVASLYRLPLGAGSSVHLLLHGLVGIVLGAQAPLAIGLGLLLQSLLFAHGGITTLGVNTCLMGFPAVLAGALFRVTVAGRKIELQAAMAGLLTAFAVALSGVITALALMTGGENFALISGTILLAHVPVMAIEGVMAALVVGFLGKVKPELLRARVVA
jgi:cobalt/nickel transport system permease protein